MIHGSLYTVRIVGEKYKNFRNTIKSVSNGSGLACNNFDTAKYQTVQNFLAGNNSDSLYRLLEDTVLPPFKGAIQKIAKYTESSIKKTVRMYEVFFQYPIHLETVLNEANLKFALQVDVLMRCISTSFKNSFEAEVVGYTLDTTIENPYNEFIVKFSNAFAKEENSDESSGRQSTTHRSVSSGSSSRSTTSSRSMYRLLSSKLEKARKKKKELLATIEKEREKAEKEKQQLLAAIAKKKEKAKKEKEKAEKEKQELLTRIERERKKADKEKKELLEKIEREREKADKEKKELLEKIDREREKAEKEKKELLESAKKN